MPKIKQIIHIDIDPSWDIRKTKLLCQARFIPGSRHSIVCYNNFKISFKQFINCERCLELLPLFEIQQASLNV